MACVPQTWLPGRVLPDAPTTATMQPLDLLEHVCTCLVVDFHPLGISGRQVGQPIWICFSRGPGGRPSSNLHGISLALLLVEQFCAAAMKIASSSWLLRGRLAALICQAVAGVNQPIHSDVTPPTADKSPREWSSAIRGRPSCGPWPLDPEKAAASFSGSLNAWKCSWWRFPSWL